MQTFRNGYSYDNDCCFWGNLSLEYKYNRTWKECQVAESIFPRQTLTFVGSNVATRTTNDLIADYFGMATDTNIRVCLNPLIQFHKFNIGLTLGLSNICDGLWLQVNAPVIHTKWDLRHDCCSNCSTSCCSSSCCSTCPTANTALSSTAFNGGYMNHTATGTTAPATVAPLTNLTDALTGKVFGDMTEAWLYGKFCGCDNDDTKVGIVDVKLGYNFYECPDYHVGIYLKMGAPTGTRLDCCHATCLFNPIIGNDHWQFGAGLSAHADLWCCDDCHTVTAYFEGYVTHLFERSQARSFDFKNGVMSRYMLLKVFDENNAYSRLINAINYTTRCVKVRADVLGEALLEFVYRNECGFGAGVGYNLYGRSKDKICQVCDPCSSSMKTIKVGFKGCAPVQPVGFLTTTATETITTGTAVYNAPSSILSATQSNATAFACGTVDSAVELYDAATTGTPTSGFVYLDTRQTATATAGDLVSTLRTNGLIASESATGTVDITTAGVVTGLTLAPELITTADLDICSGEAPSIVTHKIFGHLDYTWTDCDWTPFLRAGAEVEFASKCDKGTLNMWGVFLGGGISF